MGIWSDTGSSSPFHERRADPGRAEAAGRMASWTRERFALDASWSILVTEERTTIPGFPPRATRVHFRAAGGAPHHFRVFKPLAEVDLADLPPAWMRPALVQEAPDCNCC